MANKLFKQEMPKIPVRDTAWNPNDSLGQKIEKVFIRIFQSITLWGWEFFAELMTQIFDASMKILKPGMMRVFEPLITEIENTRGLPDNIKAMIRRAKNEEGEMAAIGLGLIVLMIGAPLLQQVVAPIAVGPSQDVTAIFPRTLPSPNLIARMLARGQITQEQADELMQWAGYDSLPRGMFYVDAVQLPTLGEGIEFFRRGLYNRQEFDIFLRQSGFPPGLYEKYADIAFQLPPVGDLIRMMVREAFSETTVQRFGYDDDYPSDIDKLAEQSGIKADWVKRYWRAHWTLPSPTQAFEMLHRGLINQEDLLTLLKTADYPTFWRDKLMNISYNVMTRVDVRRLLQAGIIDAEKALDTYKKMGYTPEDAQLLTDFAVAGISQDERDLTKTDIINLYEEGLTDRGATASALIKMGYDSQEADEILKLADVNIAKAARTDAINYVKEKYQARTIDKQGAQNELVEAGLKQQSIDRYLLAWDRVNAADIALPSMTDIKRWYLGDYITETQLRDYLKLHKHTPANVEIYVKELKDTKAQAENEGTTPTDNSLRARETTGREPRER